MFSAFIQLDEETVVVPVQVRNPSQVPTDADAVPKFRIYGNNGYLEGSADSCVEIDTGTITAASNATPVVITSAGHGLTVGTFVHVRSVGGNTNANGYFFVSAVTTDTFTLQGSIGNGAYTSGGTWHVAGLYGVSIQPQTVNGYGTGNYTAIVAAAIGGQPWGENVDFAVT